MKKFALQAIILIVVIFGGLLYASQRVPGFTPPKPKPVITAKEMVVDNITINVEVADTAEKRQLGLGGREFLASDSGMLFSYDKPDKYPFWMKGMKIPLDFIWIRDQKVVDLLKNVQPPQSRIKDKDLPLYAPNQPIDQILEVNSGFIDAHNIQVGDYAVLK